MTYSPENSSSVFNGELSTHEKQISRILGTCAQARFHWIPVKGYRNEMCIAGGPLKNTSSEATAYKLANEPFEHTGPAWSVAFLSENDHYYLSNGETVRVHGQNDQTYHK